MGRWPPWYFTVPGLRQNSREMGPVTLQQDLGPARRDHFAPRGTDRLFPGAAGRLRGRAGLPNSKSNRFLQKTTRDVPGHQSPFRGPGPNQAPRASAWPPGTLLRLLSPAGAKINRQNPLGDAENVPENPAKGGDGGGRQSELSLPEPR